MIYLNKRENQIYTFFQNNESATIEQVAIAQTGESRQNLYNPGFHRLKGLGIIQESGETQRTTNGGIAQIYVKGKNFKKHKIITPHHKEIIKEIRRLEAELSEGSEKPKTTAKTAKPVKATVEKTTKVRKKVGKGSGAIKYTTPKQVFRALRDGKMPVVNYHTTIYNKAVTDKRKAMYREGHALWKAWKAEQAK